MMKKQLLIAAVVATMSVPALASISISGTSKITYTNVDSTTGGNSFGHEIDVNINGKAGNSAVSINLEHKKATDFKHTNGTTAGGESIPATDVDDHSSISFLNVKDIFTTTKLQGMDIKLGQWWSSSDGIIDGDGARKSGKFQATTSVGPLGVGFYSSTGGNESVSISFASGGASAYYEQSGDNWANTVLSLSRGPFSIKYNDIKSDTDAGVDEGSTSYKVEGKVSGVTVTYITAEKRNSSDASHDDYFGYIDGLHKISGVGAKLSLAGNSVTVQSFKVDTSNVAASEDKYTRFVVNRSLGGGVDLKGTYVNKSAAVTANDSRTLEIKVTLAF